MLARRLRTKWFNTSALLIAFVATTMSPSYAQSQSNDTTSGRLSVPQNSNIKSYSSHLKSDWHFQVTYGISPADIEAPFWNTSLDPAAEEQRSTVGVLNQTRYSHAVEFPFNPKQSLRLGVSLINEQTAPENSWTRSLVKNSKAPEWRASGLGGDFYLLSHVSEQVSFDAGLQADYYLSGVTTLANSESAKNSAAVQTRLNQKSGWRLAFSGGITFAFLGPVGLITRVSGYVMESTFKGHSQPLRAQGFQLQLGADLALGRGDP